MGRPSRSCCRAVSCRTWRAATSPRSRSPCDASPCDGTWHLASILVLGARLLARDVDTGRWTMGVVVVMVCALKLLVWTARFPLWEICVYIVDCDSLCVMCEA